MVQHFRKETTVFEHRLAIILRVSTVIVVAAAQGSSTADVPATGDTWPGAAPLDELVQATLTEHDAAGAALAVARDGHLLYARGFGLAQRETSEPVQPQSLFRIASISKPITAVAILQLIEQGKLSLDDKIYDLLDLASQNTDPERFDPRWKNVTIRHLLDHTGGWDRNMSFDPMFQPVLMAAALGKKPPASATDIIHFMLTQPLDFDPGARHAYSNFGYNLLGRVLENATGKPYETYVREVVLEPLGIKRMKIGGSLETSPGEVHYYEEGGRTGLAVVGEPLGRRVAVPYGTWYHEALDAHGGWIASAVDLVRFGDSIRCVPGPILSEGTFGTMLSPPDGPAGHLSNGDARNAYYALGWSVKSTEDAKKDFSHAGSLPGTSTVLYCRADGFVWAVLFNMRAGRRNQELAPFLTSKINSAIDQISDWPDHDLFDRLLGHP